MKTIWLSHPFNKKNDEPLVMALGYFDGVHLGHQKVIRTAKQIADQYGYKSAVMTFHPHPSVVLGRSQQHVRFITPLKEKEKQIAKLGVDYLYVVEFTPEFAYLLPQQFVDEYIIELGVKHVVAGFDFTYGRLGKGTMETLPFHSREQFTQTVIPKQTFGEEKISSTYIRQRLAEGDVEQLPHLLGRWYEVTGTVIHGDKRGRTIGFPTANVALDDDYMIPRIGVYAVTVTIDDNMWTGVCNVGYKPTFHAQQQKDPSIEVHLFDFSSDIYGAHVCIQWHKRLRDERAFSSVDELVEQIHRDAQAAREYFQNPLAFYRKNMYSI
ncbi:riboflavin kinase/FMN adenylyltransferase [Anoxybacillus kamchatkensis]|uniref:bifunctional riboflavin kinase/FAD synthetase n=1 Tax=Anoxybacillus ayderensis TaxID=265546 RepID=UPI0015ECCB84|nr:bifunctional riboflavin kinase/FAD synthetase [Anoxybacillus ayderensis]MBA2878648.1 riboflavin kinase/FMN adenylyltransferase [Anoxybacillus ayderensis]